MTSEQNSHGPLAAVPIIVPLGFAGSRHLISPHSLLDDAQRRRFVDAVEEALHVRIEQLRAELGLGAAHVLCGISQIAIGGDSLFTRVCARQQLPQRIFLPQPRDEYLSALDVSELPDFEHSQRGEAELLLASDHIIEERVVSDAADRGERFSDTNLEIIRVSDVFVCLLRSDAVPHSGGTVEFLSKARTRGYPVLELRVHERDGAPEISEFRHNWPGTTAASKWRVPRLPIELRTRRIETTPEPARRVDIFAEAETALQQLARIGDDESVLQRRHFRYAALVIISAHLSATACAVVLALIHLPTLVQNALLALEFGLLACGVGTHLWLHRARAAHSWATFRLTAELSTGVQAMRNLRVSLEYLFTLPFPATLLPVLRTMYVLHLVVSRRSNMPWTEARSAYISERLEGARGQIAYYTRELGRSKRRLRMANLCFVVVTSLALVTTPVKLWLLPLLFGAAAAHPATGTAASIISILFPMIAVAALSLASSFDLEARVHTYEEALHDLRGLSNGIRQADSAREFAQFALRAERELLAETANWASRRSFTSVT